MKKYIKIMALLILATPFFGFQLKAKDNKVNVVKNMVTKWIDARILDPYTAQDDNLERLQEKIDEIANIQTQLAVSGADEKEKYKIAAVVMFPDKFFDTDNVID